MSHLGEVLAGLDGRVADGRGDAGRFLHVLHLHLLVVDPQVRRPQLLLAAFPLPGAVARPLPAAQRGEAESRTGQRWPTATGQQLKHDIWCLRWSGTCL